MRDNIGLLFVGLALLFLIAILYGHRTREHFAQEANAWETIQREVETDLSTFLVFDVATFRKNTSDQQKFFAMIDGQLTDDQKAQKKAAADAAAEVKVSNNTDLFNTGIDTSWEFIQNETPVVADFVKEFGNMGINIRSPTTDEDPNGQTPFGKMLKPYFNGTFDLSKPFNTRIALLDASYAHTIANNKKGTAGIFDTPDNPKATDSDKQMMKQFFLMTIPLRHIVPGAKSVMYTIAKAYMSSPYIGLLNAKVSVRTGSESVLSSIFGS